MTELLSLVVQVKPAVPLTVPAHLGRAVHALLLRWLDSYDARLAKRWHDDDGLKPFTCSSLIGGKRVDRNARLLTPDSAYWFRLTSLDDEVTAALRERLAHPPKTIDLDGVILSVTGMTADGHPGAGTARYDDLAAPYLLASATAPRRLSLRLLTPTAFHRDGMNVPLPLPELVFGSLCDRWNAFSPVALSPEVRAYAKASVALTNFRLRSRGVPQKDGGVQVGVVGTAGYVAVTYDRYWMGALALLAEFALYAGIGRGTTMGMGQARRISDRAPETPSA